MDPSIPIAVASATINIALASSLTLILRQRVADSRRTLEEARLREAYRQAEMRKRWGAASL